MLSRVNLAILALSAVVVGMHCPPVYAQSRSRVTRRVTALMGLQGRVLWIDGTANLTRTVDVNGHPTVENYTTTQSGVDSIVRHCVAAHINTIVVDVKPISGQVLYNSSIAPHLTEWQGRAVPNFDILAAFIAAGHKAGLQVDANINLLSEGHKYYGIGPAYQHPTWQSIVYSLDRGIITPTGARLPIACDGEPGNPERPILLDSNISLPTSEEQNVLEQEITPNEAPIAPSNQQLNVELDASNKVVGYVQSGMLQGELISPPDEGRLLKVTRPTDIQWVQNNLTPGLPLRFDMRTEMVPIAQAPSEHVACFVDPLNQEVRQYELSMVREIVSNYDIDGLVMDRCRDADIFNDFSPLEKSGFEQFLGRQLTNWPEDVLYFSQRPGAGYRRGPLFDKWLEFRSTVTRNMVQDVAKTARAIKPDLQMGIYVGSWYPGYYIVGVNWGSRYTSLHYDWFAKGYRNTGYAEFFNWISPGCYYPTITMQGADEKGKDPESTVEYNVRLADQAVADGTFLYPGILVPDYEGHPERLVKAMQTAAAYSEGWMLFDLSYINDFKWWPYLNAAFPTSAAPPSSSISLQSQIRSARSSASNPR